MKPDPTLPMDKLDHITQSLSDFKIEISRYIGADTEWKRAKDKQLDTIEAQVKTTNGQVITLNTITQVLPELKKQTEDNTKWIQTAKAQVVIIGGAVSVVISLLTAWIKSTFIDK